MVNATEFKKYIGNAALYLDIDRYRQRTFLKRNITKVLEEHKKTVNANSDGLDGSMWNEYEDTKTWDLPNQEMLDLLATQRNPMLKVEVKSLLPMKTSDPKGRPAPNRKKAKLYTAKCRIDIKIWTYDKDKVRETLINDSRQANLQARRDEHGRISFDVSMDEPFLVRLNKLFIDFPRGNGFKKTTANSYTMLIVFSFPDMEDAKTVIPILNNKKYELPANLAKFHISAKWRKLPNCPTDRLRLTRVANGETRDLDYEVDGEIGWRISEDTTMQDYNRVVRSIRGVQTQATQLPSPVSETQPPEKVVRLTYFFKDQPQAKTISLEGCLCLFCHRRNYHTMERLHHHFKAEHDMFIFKIDKGEKQRDNCMFFPVSIEVDISDRYSDPRASNNVADPREISWVAPKKPFNLSQYLEGDESWVASGLGVKRKQYVSKNSVTAPVSAVEPKKPSHVRDMPTTQRRKYRVPKAPQGIRFFRADSKRPLEENEYLSESDDSIGEDWLKLRRNQATKDVNADIAAKTFMMKWDDYMQDELLSGDIHVGDALVRFTRKYRAWLKRPDMSKEFLRKVKELRSDSIISEAVFEACNDFIYNDGKEIEVAPDIVIRDETASGVEVNGTSSPKKTIRKYVPGGPGGGGRYIEVEIGERKKKNHSVSKKAQSTLCSERRVDKVITFDNNGDLEIGGDTGPEQNATKPPLQEECPEEPAIAIQTGCICGKVVEDDRSAICCASLGCQRQEFHLACVGLRRRISDWVCPDCK